MISRTADTAISDHNCKIKINGQGLINNTGSAPDFIQSVLQMEEEANVKKRYQIADTRLLISTDLFIQSDAWSELFETAGSESEADFRIAMRVAELPEYPRKSELYTGGKRETFKAGGCLVSYYREPNRLRQFCYEEDGGKGRLTVIPEFSHYATDIRNIWNKIDLSRILLHQGGLILHASYIIWKGGAILFTAPSGTGKSTQAELWAEYQHAEVINGDRAVLREKDGEMRAYGLPFAGSSGICVNKSAPVRAVVVLAQAAENAVYELTPAEAIKHLYSQCALNRWNREEVEEVFGVLAKMVQKTKVVKLDCLPNLSAVEILSDYLERMEGGSEPCGQ